MTKRNLRLFALFLACLVPAAVSRGQDSSGHDSSSPDSGCPDSSSQDSRAQAPDAVLQPSKPADFNTDIYYRNKLEFSFDTGVLFANVPFIFDIFQGGDYTQLPLHYTLVPIFPSLRWHMGNLRGPSFLRGNTDFTVTPSFTAIPRGPETKYGALDVGVRRNFVHRNWRVAPYFEFRMGAGFIDARGPVRGRGGNGYAQGQDFTFTLMLGPGLRYNFNPRYSMVLGTNYMHVSNAYLSEPKFMDNGINVYGPMVGFNLLLGKPKEAQLR